MKTQLLCTFTTKEELQTSLQEIRTKYRIVYNYIYVLQNKGNLNELFVTYNIDTQYQPDKPLENTILVHRKKQSNTLYTINALNELVKEENNGVLDKTFSIDWNKFKNSIIVTNVEGTKKISTRVFEIIDFSKNN
jgi:hypothetical protein|tara:strand:- start:8240 stop:8644 length:405 start_codon:yes stop_codon:yes gene_type:complete